MPLQPDWVPFLRLLGAVQEPTEGGQARIHLPQLRDDLCNQLPAAHGGVVMTLLDVAMARSATSRPGAPSNTAVTVEMSSRFLHPGRGPLVAEGRVISSGRSLCTCEAHVCDASGTIIACAMGTFKYWHAPLGNVE
ncbi:MAG: phenylacetic acid degradation protein [Hymenobacter sp.]|jgi:uncharacterized protein (TIGR00369 family)|nr:phenylacetic acid degradation protein [Hymenobacter sp.]